MKAEDFLNQGTKPAKEGLPSKGMSAEAFLNMPAEEPIVPEPITEPAAEPGFAQGLYEQGKGAVSEFFRPSFAPEPTVPVGMEGMPEAAIPAGMPEDIDVRRAAINQRLGQVSADMPEAQELVGELEDLKQMEYGTEMARPISAITGKPVPTPEERMLGGITEPGKYDFMDRAREIKEEGVVPFVPFVSGAKEVRDMARVSAAAYKLKEGTASPEEKADLLEFVEKANRDTTFGYKVINTVAAMPAFMGEFLLTSGLYTAGRKVGTKAATKTLENYLGGAGRKLLEKDLGRIGVGIAGGVAGGTLQAPIMGAPRIISGTIERSMPKLKLSRDEEGGINAVIAGEGEDFLVASTMALGNQWAETVSEHSGGLFRMLNGSAKNAAIRAGLFSATMKVNPGMSPNKVNTLFGKMAYHGVINEMLEERVGEGLRAGLGLQEYKMPTAEQLAVELVSFSVPGVIQALGAKAFEKREVFERHTEEDRRDISYPETEVVSAAPGLSETQRELAKEVIREKMAKQLPLIPSAAPVLAIPEEPIPPVPPGMPPPVAPEPVGPAPGALPPGQGFGLVEPTPEVRLRPGPERIEGPEYPEGVEYVAGKPAPEELEVEHRPILSTRGLPWKEEGNALKALRSREDVSPATHKVVKVKKGYGIVPFADKRAWVEAEAKPEEVKGKTLIAFVRAMGGIKDATLPGEIRALSPKETGVVGLTTNVPDKGLGFDEMAAAAVEHGWLPENLEDQAGAFSEMLKDDIFAQKEKKPRIERLADVAEKTEREERWKEFERAEDAELEYFAKHPDEEIDADLDKWQRETIAEIRSRNEADRARKIEENIASKVEKENPDLGRLKKDEGFPEYIEGWDEKDLLDEEVLAELEAWRAGEEVERPPALEVHKRKALISRGFPQPATFSGESVEVLGVVGETGRRGEILGTTLEELNKRGGQVVIRKQDGSSVIALMTSIKLEAPPAKEEISAKPIKPKAIKIPELKNTEEALAFGKTATPEQVEALKAKKDESLLKSNALKAKGDLQGAMDEAVRGQLFREAIESAEGKVAEVKKPKEPVAEIPEKKAEPPMSPELRELHDHRARTLGFEKAGGSFVEGYLKKLAKVAEKTDMSAATAAYSALSEYKKGNMEQASLDAEKILGKLHKAETEALISKPKVAPEVEKEPVLREPEAKYLIAEFTEKYRQSELDLAFGGKKKADAAIESVAKKVDRVSRRRMPDRVAEEIPKSKVAEELRKRKRVDLTGRKLTEGNESQEIAELFQVYRSPKMEILHAIYTDADGTILGHSAITSGNIGAVNPGDRAKYVYRMKSAAKRLGAAKVHILHNHPSGNPTMSSNDVAFARNLRRKPTLILKNRLGDLMGEFVVIDHGRFSWVSEYLVNGEVYVTEGTYKIAPGTDEWMSKKGPPLSNPSRVASFGQSLAYNKSKACFIYVDHANNVQGWSVHDNKILKKSVSGLEKILRQQAKGHNANKVVIIADDMTLLEPIARYGNVGDWLLDALDTKGNSLRETVPAGFGVIGKPTKPAWGLFEPEAEYGRTTEVLKTATKEVKGTWDDIKKMADEYLGSISTRLANIDPSLKAHLRNFEYKAGTTKGKRIRQVQPLFEKIKNMSKEDKATLDLARKNADAKTLQRLIIKYNLGKEYKATRFLLNKMYAEAKGVGYKTGYRKHFHPRVIKDPKGFLEYLMDKEDWPLMDKAIKAREIQLGRYLEEDEKAQVINSLLRGFGRDKIMLSIPGQLKERAIRIIWPELNKFYMDSDAALLRYIGVVTDAIEARKVFGVKRKEKKATSGTLENDINDTIGHYVLDLLAKGKIRPDQEHTLREIYQARFNEVGTRGIVGLYKNLSYIDTMGSPISAITQIGDLAWALYRAGIPKTFVATWKAVTGKSALKKEDLGIERIAQEFADTSKMARAVTKVFKVIGLEKIDNIGKEALINAGLKKVQNRAKNPKKLNALWKELEPTFGQETDALVDDFKNDRISENVKLYLFNTLLDFQPVALSEMPQKYLEGGNGRIFYMLKTFTLKQFDIYRREIFQQIGQPGTRLKGLKNLITLAACFVAANASADIIKSLILNRPIDPDDLTVDNLLRLLGISKFVTWKARQEGVGSAMVRQVAPPFKLMDALSKDIMRAGDEKGLETVASIPVIGKLYYWWFGRGAEKSERRKKRLESKKKPEGLKKGRLKGGLAGGRLKSRLK